MRTLNIFFLILGFFMTGASVLAQSAVKDLGDFERISIAPYVSDQIEYLPTGAKSNLQSKLGQIITSNGFGSSVYNTRFILTPNIEVVSKNVVASAPPRVAVKLDVHLFVGDGISGTKFGSTLISVNGVGSNENKAYIAALKQIKPGNPAIGSLISSAKHQILDFYNSQCDFILREAEMAASQNDFEEALFVLSTIPQINMECYEKATNLIRPVYLEKINRECQLYLSEARNTWNASQNYGAALGAIAQLKKIEPSAACFKEAQELSNEIGTRMREIDDREWDFELREQELEERKIDAVRQVGVAYGKNQPQNMTYNLGGWW